MGEIVFIGLGLFDEKDITVKGLEAARNADAVFAEFYTSSLRGTTVETLELLIRKPIRVLTRKELEQGTEILEAARDRRVALHEVKFPRDDDAMKRPADVPTKDVLDSARDRLRVR